MHEPERRQGEHQARGGEGRDCGDAGNEADRPERVRIEK
jgi:hypothetical protein